MNEADRACGFSQRRFLMAKKVEEWADKCLHFGEWSNHHLSNHHLNVLPGSVLRPAKSEALKRQNVQNHETRTLRLSVTRQDVNGK
jgi:hypothetical protein